MRATTLAAPAARSTTVVEVIAPAIPRQKSQTLRYIKKAVKRLSVIAIFVAVPLLLGLYWIPLGFAGYVVLGLIDVMRNTRRTPSTIDRYFFGNGFFTWILAPFNLLMDLLCLPFRNKGVYNIEDLPKGHQDEI